MYACMCMCCINILTGEFQKECDSALGPYKKKVTQHKRQSERKVLVFFL